MVQILGHVTEPQPSWVELAQVDLEEQGLDHGCALLSVLHYIRGQL